MGASRFFFTNVAVWMSLVFYSMVMLEGINFTLQCCYADWIWPCVPENR